MSRVNQPGPRPVVPQRRNALFQQSLSQIPIETPLSRYNEEQPSISSQLSLGDSGYQTLKTKANRLILDDFDERFPAFGPCECCQVEGAHGMFYDLDEIIRSERVRRTRR